MDLGDRDWAGAERFGDLRGGEGRLTGRLTCLILVPIYCDQHVLAQIFTDPRLARARCNILDRRRLRRQEGSVSRRSRTVPPYRPGGGIASPDVCEERFVGS